MGICSSSANDGLYFDFVNLGEEEDVDGFKRDVSIKLLIEDVHDSDEDAIKTFSCDVSSDSSDESSEDSDDDGETKEKPDSADEQRLVSSGFANGRSGSVIGTDRSRDISDRGSGKFNDIGWGPRSHPNQKPPSRHYHRSFRPRRGSSISNVATSPRKKYVATASDASKKLRSRQTENGMHTLVTFEGDDWYVKPSSNGIWDFFNTILCGVPTVIECPADPGMPPPLKSVEEILRG